MESGGNRHTSEMKGTRGGIPSWTPGYNRAGEEENWLFNRHSAYLLGIKYKPEKIKLRNCKCCWCNRKSGKMNILNFIAFKFRKQWITHWFLYVPECLVPLLGRDLLSKLEAQTAFKDGEIQLLVPDTKAIKARTFMLQGTPEPDSSGGILRNSSKCSNIPGLSWRNWLFPTSSAC